MGLTDILRKVGKGTGRSMRNYAVAGALAVGALGYSGGARGATTIEVDPSWSMTEINNILDNDPLTKGKNNDGRVLQHGDTVHFAAGTYQLPQEGPGIENYYLIGVSGNLGQPIIIQGDGAEETIFKGYDSEHVRVWKVTASNVEFRDIQTASALTGAKVTGSNYEGVLFKRVTFKGHGQHHFIFEQVESSDSTTQPSIGLENCFFDEGGVGVHFSGSKRPTAKTKYVGVKNSTMRKLTANGIDAPWYYDGGVPVVKGNDDFQGNLYYEGASAFLEDLYPKFSTPQGYVEAQNTGLSLQDRNIQPTSGPRNISFTSSTALMLSANGRPLPGSPLVGLRYPLGYAGALTPYNGFVKVDSDGDGDVDMDDFGEFQRCFSGTGRALDSRNCSGADLDGDGDVDGADFTKFNNCASGPNIPVNSNCLNP